MYDDAGDTLARVEAELEERLVELRPLVDECARIEQALAALRQEATPKRRRGRRPKTAEPVPS